MGARGRAPQAPRAFRSLLREQKTWARQTKGPPPGLCGKRVGADRDGTGPSTLERPSRLAASLLKVGGWRLGLASFGCGKRPLAPSSTGLLGPASVVYGALGLLGWAGAWQGWSTVSLAARVGWSGLNEVSASSCLLLPPPAAAILRKGYSVDHPNIQSKSNSKSKSRPTTLQPSRPRFASTCLLSFCLFPLPFRSISPNAHSLSVPSLHLAALTSNPKAGPSLHSHPCVVCSVYASTLNATGRETPEGPIPYPGQHSLPLSLLPPLPAPISLPIQIQILYQYQRCATGLEL